MTPILARIFVFLAENKHLWLVPILMVFLLFSAAVIAEQNADQPRPPAFGYRMF
jgi:hypothetical protein